MQYTEAYKTRFGIVSSYDTVFARAMDSMLEKMMRMRFSDTYIRIIIAGVETAVEEDMSGGEDSLRTIVQGMQRRNRPTDLHLFVSEYEVIIRTIQHEGWGEAEFNERFKLMVDMAIENSDKFLRRSCAGKVLLKEPEVNILQ